MEVMVLEPLSAKLLLATSVENVPVAGVVVPIFPGDAHVSPSSSDTFRLGTTVVEDTDNGAVPVNIVDINCVPDIVDDADMESAVMGAENATSPENVGLPLKVPVNAPPSVRSAGPLALNRPFMMAVPVTAKLPPILVLPVLVVVRVPSIVMELRVLGIMAAVMAQNSGVAVDVVQLPKTVFWDWVMREAVILPVLVTGEPNTENNVPGNINPTDDTEAAASAIWIG